MGERQRHDRPIGRHPAKPVRQVPQERKQPKLDMLKTIDPRTERERLGALDCAAQQLVQQLRPARTPQRHLVVKQSDARWLNHAPIHVARDRRRLLELTPGTQQRSRSEKLAPACPLGDGDAADRHLVENEQTEQLRRPHRAEIMLATAEFHDLSHGQPPRLLQLVERQDRPERGILIQQANATDRLVR